MATAIGGIGKQVLGELGDVVKKVAKDTAKAGVDIVKGTVETAVGGGDDKGQDDVSSQAPGSSPTVGVPDPMQQMKQKKKQEKAQGLNRVRRELADYVAKKKQEDDQEEVVEEKQGEVKKQEEEQKKETERDIQISQAHRSGGGTGEMSRKKH